MMVKAMMTNTAQSNNLESRVTASKPMAAGFLPVYYYTVTVIDTESHKSECPVHSRMLHAKPVYAGGKIKYLCQPGIGLAQCIQ